MVDRADLRKSRLVKFDLAAAGHEGVLTNSDGDMVVKPCTAAEIAFYDSLTAHPSLQPHVPGYFGALSLGNDTLKAPAALKLPPEVESKEPKLAKTATVPVVNHAWKSSGGGKIDTEQALVLENVAAGFKKPNILDVKLGARLWADDAPAEKRARLDKVASETTSKPLGFRIAGMKVHHGLNSASGPDVGIDGYRIFDKNYGRALTPKTVVNGFKEFFRLDSEQISSAETRKVVRRFITDLESLTTVLEAEESRMYSASLLFVYEGDPVALHDSFAREADMIKAFQSEKIETGTSLEDVKLNAIQTDETRTGAEATGHEDSDSEEGPPQFPAIQTLRLIDFAHAQWTAGQGRDENLLHGVRSVRMLLQSLL